MIRFCDRKMHWIEYCAISDQYSLSREGIQNFFSDGHQDDVVCVRDSITKGFKGIITHQSLIRFPTVHEAVRGEYLIFNEDIWKNAREYCRRHPYSSIEYLIPVLDQYHKLYCFAYEDLDANCEIRMLRELTALPDALQFTDIYSEYKCVKIYGFNELAFYFARYLEQLGVSVEVSGAMWQFLFNGQKCTVSDLECFTIYAEGIHGEKYNWKENLLRSVSVEFECINIIYEENIKKGIICDAGCECIELFSYLKDKDIILLGIGNEEQAAYDFLLGKGIDIYCFSCNERNQLHSLFGKSIMSKRDAMNECSNPVFIDCICKNSAWGFGEVDYFDYIGYKRNINYFFLRDYVEIPDSCLLNVLQQWKIVLAGDIYLCKYLYNFFESKKLQVLGYMEVLSQDDKWEGKKYEKESFSEEVLCLYAIPELAASESIKVKEMIQLHLSENGLYNYSDYYSYTNTFINIEEFRDTKIRKRELMPKRIVLGSIEDCSGNMFFKGLLDGHPEVLSMDFAGLNNNLFWFCICLSMEQSRDILSLFWKMYEEKGGQSIYDVVSFNEKMNQLLDLDIQFTPQELFVMIFVSFSYMYRKNVEIAKSVIYWEPHCLNRKISDEYVRWLGMEEVPCDMICIVRNACITAGSRIKGIRLFGWRGYTNENAYIGAFTYGLCNFPAIEKREYKWSDRLIIKFEELKCNPREILSKICNDWGIEWSDSLMCVTRYGEKRTYFNGERKISDFDLEPVYNTYEEYFSEYDRFRIMLLNSQWQKKYGYPYVGVKQFSRREIQEMWLKEFRFENLFNQITNKIEFEMKIQYDIKNQLKQVRLSELYNNDGYDI
ncbi:MAG: hypothetical protein K2O91_20845 [Lachnospiraceae bacterium]|nr:hypothetical protein [Lachnospiraceae bacterium]